MEGTELRDQANVTLVTNKMDVKLMSSPVDGRERIKIEFYKTYDVMTGIRIAATLGGFFSMMILLVLYKNYCKPSKTLSEEQLNAAVTAAVEEEDRALKAALEATSFYTSLSKHRQSSTVEDAPPMISPRFSSVGGGCSHLTPPVRFSHLQQRGKSLPGSALTFAAEEVRADGPKGAESPREDEEGENNRVNDVESRNYLGLLPPDRRLSSVTCSSGDTSYLERRGSAFEMGHPAPPFFIKSMADENKPGDGGPWDFYYPIDIQVIQPTPEISPAPSAETLCEKPDTVCKLQVPGFNDTQRLSADFSERGIAPLASISSLASFGFPSSIVRPSRNSTRDVVPAGNDDSVGSDSVFIDEEVYTEDEVEEFSTDSEFEFGEFDDDYSFCESTKRHADNATRSSNGNSNSNSKGNPRFASFDSYDASIGRDSISEDNDNIDRDKPSPIARYNLSPSESKRKLSKTHSEPRSQMILRQLPSWIDKGKSDFVPKRQLSVPASRRKSKGRNLAGKEENLSQKSNNRESPPIQSFRNEDKRKRLQKQKTVDEEDTPLHLVTSSEIILGKQTRLNILGTETSLVKEQASELPEETTSYISQ